MEFYAAVRRSVYVEGLSERAAARRFGLARETVRKMLRYRLPPGYRRAKPIRCPKLDAFTGVIDQILTDDQQRPKKQRHTAKRIWERLCVEHAFTGGHTIVKDYVRRQKLGGQEMFVPLAHPPGDAQADFGEALVVIDGVECKAHDLVVDLPHSDDAFVQAFPAETTEAFCEGHNAAFRYFGGVPRGIVYDNTTLAVAKILGDGTRQRTQSFSELHSHYLFDDRFGRPGKGNDKGKVEGLVGYARRNFFVPGAKRMQRDYQQPLPNIPTVRECAHVAVVAGAVSVYLGTVHLGPALSSLVVVLVGLGCLAFGSVSRVLQSAGVVLLAAAVADAGLVAVLKGLPHECMR